MNVVNQPIVKHKLGLLNLAEELGNVSQACKIMGVSRDTFYRYQEAKDSGGVAALLHKDRRRPNLKNRVDEVVEQAVLAYAMEQPAHGQVRVSNELRKRGTFISPSGVRSIWLRHDVANFKQRLKALEKHLSISGAVLTEAQVTALEKKREDDLACGEIETAHPGYLGSQDTFYVGTMKAWGAFTSRPLWTPTARWRSPSCTPPRHRSPQQTCSTVRCFRSLPSRACRCCAF